MPTTFAGSALVQIACAFGVASTQNTSFQLVSIDSAGQIFNHTSWTHASGVKHAIVSMEGITTLHGRTVYIKCTEGGAGASGYTATLMWQQ